MYVCAYLHEYVCYICTYIRTYVCMYVRMYVCTVCILYRKSGNVQGLIIFVGTLVPRKLNT